MSDILNDTERDMIGELGNMSMGAAATVLSTLLGNIGVLITTPIVSTIKYKDIFKVKEKQIGVKIDYIKGITGLSFLVLTKKNANIITNLMCGQKENFINYEDDILSSAIGEAMNEMIGSSCTMLSQIINSTIDMSTPSILLFDENTEPIPYNKEIGEKKDFVKISFDLTVENYINSTIALFFDVNTAKFIIEKMQIGHQSAMENIKISNFDIYSGYFNKYINYLNSTYTGYLEDPLVLEDIKIIDSVDSLNIDIYKNLCIVSKDVNKKILNAFIFSNDILAYFDTKFFFNGNKEALQSFLNSVDKELKKHICNELKVNLGISNVLDILDIPQDKYVMAVCTIGGHKVYQIINKCLFENNENISNLEKENIDVDEIKNTQKKSDADEILINKKCLGLFNYISVDVSVVIGEKIYLLEDLLKLTNGSIIRLDKHDGDDLDICMNSIKKAEGTLYQVNYSKTNFYAIKINKIFKGGN